MINRILREMRLVQRKHGDETNVRHMTWGLRHLFRTSAFLDSSLFPFERKSEMERDTEKAKC